MICGVCLLLPLVSVLGFSPNVITYSFSRVELKETAFALGLIRRSSSTRRTTKRGAAIGPYSSFLGPFSTCSAGIKGSCIYSSSSSDEEEEEEGSGKDLSKMKEEIGNLIADDEWMGLSMELSELVRVAILEDVKKQTRDFIGKEEYKVGDVSKELDRRVKDEVAKFRGKEEYELGDLSVALDQISKDFTCELTGKDDYEFGDLSQELDSRIKRNVAQFCGKDAYEVGDLSREISKRVQTGVSEFTGKDDYTFGDVTREIENRRRQWMESVLGEEAAANYQFGDLTKKTLSAITGKDDYEFGDVTKKVLGDLFGKRKRGGGNN